MEKEVSQLTLFDLDILYGKMSLEHSAPPGAKISGRSSKKLSGLSTAPVMCLDLTPGNGNLLGLSFWEMNSAWLGVSWMLGTGASPKDAVVSSLSQILEESPPPKYYLSRTACLGILRRAKAREKELPPQLKMALEIQAGLISETESDMMEKLIFGKEPLAQKEKMGFDGYAGDVTEQVATTIGTDCSGINGIIEPTICLNDQGGERMDVTEGITGTLRAVMGSNLPIVMGSYQGGDEVCENLYPTITSAAGTSGNNIPLLSQPIAFSLDSSNQNPSKNQGYAAILHPQESYCIAANTIGRQPENGGNGQGVQKDISYTLTTPDIHAIYTPKPYQPVVGSLCSSDEKGIGNQYVSQDKCIIDDGSAVFGGTGYSDFDEGISTLRVSGGSNGGGSENLAVKRNLVRRLTPLECERLQGFPDGWTAIEKATDSPRYKALGNSVAIPCVDFVMGGIAFFLKQQKEEN